MKRYEMIEFLLEITRDEYERGQARLALVETKAQMIVLVVTIIAALLCTVWEHIRPATASGGILLVGTVLILIYVLIEALIASLLAEVRPPVSAGKLVEECKASMVDASADVSVDSKLVEEQMGNAIESYSEASKELQRLLADRTRGVKRAQIALLFVIVLLVVWLGLPLIGFGIGLFNK